MAAAAPLVLVITPAAAANNPFPDEDPVCLPSAHPLVTATGAFMDWQPMPAALNLIVVHERVWLLDDDNIGVWAFANNLTMASRSNPARRA
jgi:hypothetical protein